MIKDCLIDSSKEKRDIKSTKGKGMMGGVYGLAVIGAAVYYIQRADSLLNGIIGVGKAIFWPAVIMYKVLQLLKL